MSHRVVSIDLGASGTKVFLSQIKDGKIQIEELDRFESFAYTKGQLSFWDIDKMLARIMKTVDQVRKSLAITSIGFDGWGVDFVPLDENEKKLSDPMQYFAMFSASKHIQEEIARNKAFIYNTVATQYQPFNTVYQLIYLKKQSPELFSRINKIVSLPSYLAGKLAGRFVYEFTHASTTQIYDYLNHQWSPDIIDRLGFGTIFPEVVDAGTVIGDYEGVQVILPATHDTASAYAAITSDPETTLNISLGTWCLNGIILHDNEIPAEAIKTNNYAVEGCYNGSLRILANTPGLLLWEKAKAEVQKILGKACSYQELEQMALSHDDDSLAMNVDDDKYFTTDQLMKEIAGEIASDSLGGGLAYILNGIAKRIKRTKDDMERIFNRRLTQVHIIGGGVKNKLLCQKIAESTNLPVKTNPREGTALGNTIVQLLGNALINSEIEMKHLIDNSIDYHHY